MSFKRYNFLEMVAKDMIQRFGMDFRRIAVVFNNQRPIQYLNTYLASELKQVFWSPQYFTIQEFIRSSSPLSELSSTAQIFTLSKVYTRIQKEKFENYEEDLVNFFPLAELILSDFAQLDYEMVDVDRLFHYLEDLHTLDTHFDYLTPEQKEYLKRFWSSFSSTSVAELQRKFLAIWSLLPTLYKTFKEECQVMNTSTMAGMYRSLAENRHGVLDPLNEIDMVVFIGFNALNACEKTIFKRLQDQEKALFYFDVDAHYLEDPIQEAGHFFRENFGNIRLKNALGKPIRHIEAQDHEIAVIQAPGQVAQAKLLYPLLTQEWLDQPGSKVIILADESLLVPVMQSLPATKYNITMGFPIQESLTYGLFHIYVEAQTYLAKQNKKRRKGLSHGLLMDFAGHPLTGLSAEDRNGLLDALSKMERAEVSISQVQSVINQFTKKASKIIQRFFEPSTSGIDFLSRVEALWEHACVQIHPDETQDDLEKSLSENALIALQSLQQMLGQFSDIGVVMTAKLLRKVTMPVTATLNGDPFQDIQIMGILESRSLNFDHIICVGANEGFLPTLKSAPSLIPYHLRKAFGLPVLENQNGLSAYLFYRLFHNEPSLTILYNSLVSETSSGELSRFVRQLEFETSIQVKYKDVNFGLSLGKEDYGEMKQVQSPVSTIQKTGPVWEQLERFLDGKDRKLSATAFTTYLQSPLLFFFKYISGIQEPPVLQKGMEKNVLGTLVHKMMEICYEPFRFKQQVVSQQDIVNCLEKLNDIAEQAFLEEFAHDAEEAQEEMTIEIAKRYARQFLEYDRDFVAPFSILELENKDDYLWELPIQVQGQPRIVRLRGIIDRIDRLEPTDSRGLDAGQTRIVDYKTGRDDLVVKMPQSSGDLAASTYFEFFGESGDLGADNKAFIQTLFYALIYEKVSSKPWVEPNLYTYSYCRKGRSNFSLKPSRGSEIPLQGADLLDVKKGFENYLIQKLEELFNPDIPFFHPVEAELYPNDPYLVFLDGNGQEADEDGD